MIFSFKFSYENATVEENKQKLKNNLNSNIREEKFKIKFLRRFFFLWYWGRLEYTHTSARGTDYYERTHILSIGFIKKKGEVFNINGLHIVNILEHFFWFLIPFLVWVAGGGILAQCLTLLIFILELMVSYKSNKCFAKDLTEWMKKENPFYYDD